MVGTALAVTGPIIGLPGSLRARFRLKHPALVQLVRYALVGGLGTGTNALIFLVTRIWWDALPANLLALVLSTALSTEVNRRFTFGAGHTHHWRTHVQNGGTVLFYAFYSSAVLMVLDAVVDSPSPLLESLAVAGASILGGAGRFLILRYWVFGADDDTPAERSVTGPSVRMVRTAPGRGYGRHMPKYVIERELPGAGSLSDADLTAISQKSNDVLSGMPDVQWVQSYVTGDKIYCVYVAPDADRLREHAAQGGFPANSVQEVARTIDPTTGGR